MAGKRPAALADVAARAAKGPSAVLHHFARARHATRCEAVLLV